MSAPPVNPTDLVAEFADESMADQMPKSDLPPPPRPESSPEPDVGKPRRRRVRDAGTNSTAAGDRKTKKPAPEYRSGVLVKPLTDLYSSIGAMVYVVDNPCGMVILENAQKCAEALDKASKENEALRRTLHKLLETSTLGVVIAAHAPIAIQIAKHHLPAMQPHPVAEQPQNAPHNDSDGPIPTPHIVRSRNG